MSERTCEQCRWWHREESHYQNGQCRRYPPVANAYGHVTPSVSRENYCGEWRDKSITPEQERRAELVTQFAVAIVQAESDTGAELVWKWAAEYADAKPKMSHATCGGCNTQLPPNKHWVCGECAETLDALSEYVKQRSGVSREAI